MRKNLGREAKRTLEIKTLPLWKKGDEKPAGILPDPPLLPRGGEPSICNKKELIKFPKRKQKL